jgi:hypothetical protein
VKAVMNFEFFRKLEMFNPVNDDSHFYKYSLLWNYLL